MSLPKPRLTTLRGIRDALAAHGFSDAELSELVDPKFGIITGFHDLMEELDALRRTDLGATPPAGDIAARAPRDD